MKKINTLFLFLFISIVSFSQSRSDFYWSGNGSTSDNIDQADNWYTAGNPASGDNLYFNNTGTRHWPYSNYGSGSYFGNIITYDGAGGIKWRGDKTWAYKFENNSDPNLFEIESDIGNRLGSDLELNPAGSGGVKVTGNVALEDNKWLKVYGYYQLEITGVISGNGVNLHIYNAPTVILSGNNTYSGATTIEGGTLQLEGSIASSDVTVESGANLVINGTSCEIKSLTINSGGTVTINTGKALTVNGALTNNAGNAGLVINSDATGTGSLIFQSGTPAATVQRYLTTYATNNNGWHYLSSPVSGFTISGSDFEPVAGTDDLYRFDETKSSENWLNYDNTSFSETHFQLGEGYLVAYSGATATNPKTFTGNLVSGDQPIYDLSYTSSATYPGWNLFGNPFTSAIDWDLIAKSSNVNGTVYVVKSSDGTNASWNGSTGDLTDGIIPAMQGFFVNTDQTGESIFIPASSQVHNSTSVDYFKNSSKLADQTFKISLSNTDFNNNTYIQFRDDASEAFDIAIDGYKLFGFGTAPEIYTKIDDTDYSINCLPADVASYNLPLGVKIQHDGVYNLTFEGFSTFANKVNLTLEDLLTGKTVAINEGSVYTFTHTNGDSEMRFLLHFAGVNGVSSPGADAKAAIIFSSNKTIVVKSLNTSLNGTVEVINMIGQTLHVQHVDGASVSINTGLTNGVYIVRYKSDRGVLQTDKVILR